MSLPLPTMTDFRFKARVDYFTTREQAVAYAEAMRAEGYKRVETWPQAGPNSKYSDLWPVWWIDRPDEGGWYG